MVVGGTVVVGGRVVGGSVGGRVVGGRVGGRVATGGATVAGAMAAMTAVLERLALFMRALMVWGLAPAMRALMVLFTSKARAAGPEAGIVTEAEATVVGAAVVVVGAGA